MKQKSKRIKECSQNRRAAADWKLSIVNFEAGKNLGICGEFKSSIA